MDAMDAMMPAVTSRLRGMGIDPATLDERTLGQLESIQKAVDGESARIAEARRIARHGMPLTRVAELSGMARGTLYNKLILKTYAERAIRDAGVEEDRDEIARLKKALAEKDEVIAGLVKRDGELVEAKMQLRDSRQEIAGLKASQVEDQRTIAELRRMLNQANQKKKPAKIIKVR